MDEKRTLGDRLGDMADEVKLRAQEGVAKIKGDATEEYEKKLAADAKHQQSKMENLADKRMREAEKQAKDEANQQHPQQLIPMPRAVTR